MLYYRRHLPHWIPDRAVLFVTWRLAGSMPLEDPDILTVGNTGRIPFFRRDELLDRTTSGPFWLRDPDIAGIIRDALLYGEAERRFYTLLGWVIMPNHVHAVFEPHSAVPATMQWLN